MLAGSTTTRSWDSSSRSVQPRARSRSGPLRL